MRAARHVRLLLKGGGEILLRDGQLFAHTKSVR